eukprot:6011170-Pyramimonas_sp.AAC.1
MNQVVSQNATELAELRGAVQGSFKRCGELADQMKLFARDVQSKHQMLDTELKNVISVQDA